MTSSYPVLLLGADSAEQLEVITDELRARLRAPQTVPAEAAAGLAGGAGARHRRYAVVKDRAEALVALERLPRRSVRTAQLPEIVRPVVFMFPGGGAQYTGMAGDLGRSYPSFRAHVDDCAELFAARLNLDVRSVLHDDGPPADDLPLGLSALFTVEYALARLWLELGVRPAAVIGHSLGEYVAAVVAGTLDLTDAVDLVALRARLLASLPPGEMLGVVCDEQWLATRLGPGLAIAAVNAGNRCVVSGKPEAVAALANELTCEGIEVRRLHVNAAAHSPFVEPIMAEFGAALATVSASPPRLPYVSDVTGTWLTDAEATDPHYWLRHLRAPVRFAAGLRTLLAGDDAVLLEVGPGITLSTLARQNGATEVIASLRHPLDARPDSAALGFAIGELWLRGVELDLQALGATVPAQGGVR